MLNLLTSFTQREGSQCLSVTLISFLMVVLNSLVVITEVGFVAHECTSWEDYLSGICDNNRAVLMGEYVPIQYVFYTTCYESFIELKYYFNHEHLTGLVARFTWRLMRNHLTLGDNLKSLMIFKIA